MIIQRLDYPTAHKRKESLIAKRKNKSKATQSKTLALSEASILITNAPIEKLPTQLAWTFYSLRWQIELHFKTWKSLFELDKVKQMKPERILCLFFGRLIRIKLNHLMFELVQVACWQKQRIELSYWKFAKLNLERDSELKRKLFDLAKGWSSYFESITNIALRNCRKERRKGKKTPLEILSRGALA